MRLQICDGDGGAYGLLKCPGRGSASRVGLGPEGCYVAATKSRLVDPLWSSARRS